MPRKIKRYGWIPDLPDYRDLVLEPPPQVTHLPPSVDLIDRCPPIYDQEQLGSCTGNSCEALFRFENHKQTGTDYEGSRLFVYYNARSEEGTENSDSGAMIRDAIKAIHQDGVCSEKAWPYDITKFARRAPQIAYDAALLHQSLKYRRLPQTLFSMKSCLARGSPFVYGFTVYDSFESQLVAHTGIVRLPGMGEQVLGGHAVMAVGYDDTRQAFLTRNSWGTGWGLSGHFWIPYNYLTNTNLADDFWTISLVET